MDVLCCVVYVSIQMKLFIHYFIAAKTKQSKRQRKWRGKKTERIILLLTIAMYKKKYTQYIRVTCLSHTDTQLYNRTNIFFSSLQQYSSFMEMLCCPINAADSHNACASKAVFVCRLHRDRKRDWEKERVWYWMWCKRTNGMKGGVLMNTNACTSNAIVSSSFVCMCVIEIITCNNNTPNGYMIVRSTVSLAPIPCPLTICDITCKAVYVRARAHKHILLFLMNFLPFSARMTEKKTKLFKMN